MRLVLVARFTLFAALFAAQYGALANNQLWPMQPAVALEDSSVVAAKGKTDHQFTGMADYYHHSLYGKKTASGQVLEKHLYTAAHRTLPFGTHVHVKNHSNGRSCIVVINDRGPFTKSKVIDLSHSAATELGMISAGTCKVGCTVVPKPKNGAGKTELAKTEIKAIAPVKVATAKAEIPTKIASAVKAKAETVTAKAEPALALRPAIAVTTKKEKLIAPANSDQISRVDETSADLEGAEPIKWTEVQ